MIQKVCFYYCWGQIDWNIGEYHKTAHKPRTSKISDWRRAYSSLNFEGFTHLTVLNHSVNFVHLDSGAHINTIESTWRALKKSLPKNGTQKTLYDSYFSQYCIRKLYLNDSADLFLSFLNLISEVYHPNKDYFITVPVIQPVLIPRNP